jgi:redox-sensitive bicupin YhaK (pirin superfamily)
MNILNESLKYKKMNTSQRRIVYRSKGVTHGPVTRLMSPGDLGQLLKPFVFLDLFRIKASLNNFGWHPHSGIATVTVVMQGEGSYEESTGQKGVIAEGGIEYMQAGNGVFHTGGTAGVKNLIGFQLWVTLPPEAENAPSVSHYLASDEIMHAGPARVILGQYESAQSKIKTASEMNYLDVSLKAGQTWTYTPPENHTVGWLAIETGLIESGELIQAGELAVYAESNAEIVLKAKEDSRFVLGSAPKHSHDLFMGTYSVHTSQSALNKGESNIIMLGKMLKQSGRF